jgi:hypothetical protein
MTTRNSLNNSLAGTTGNGNFVGDTSPTLNNPIINNIYDANGNILFSFTSVPGAVNWTGFSNAANSNYPGIFGTGPATNVGFYVQSKGNLGIDIKGTTAGGNPTAGYVGEYISSQRLFVNAISITNNTPTTVTSISLTPGDWDVTGNVYFRLTGGTTLSNTAGGISLTSNAFGNASLISQRTIAPPTGVGVALGFPLVTQRLNLTATTTVYLIGQSGFSIGTVTVCGFIAARRVR